jgi:hypothetical protein
MGAIIAAARRIPRKTLVLATVVLLALAILWRLVVVLAVLAVAAAAAWLLPFVLGVVLQIIMRTKRLPGWTTAAVGAAVPALQLLRSLISKGVHLEAVFTYAFLAVLFAVWMFAGARSVLAYREGRHAPPSAVA